jgi:uncharacterized membrane protein YcgQ (UPF0703/DUF1980 family)
MLPYSVASVVMASLSCLCCCVALANCFGLVIKEQPTSKEDEFDDTILTKKQRLQSLKRGAQKEDIPLLSIGEFVDRRV